MIWQSLKFRLFVVAVLSIVGALFLYGVVLNQIFERHALERLNTELEGHLNQLITRLEVSSSNIVEVPQPPQNPRFLRPFGGLYWQVEAGDSAPFGSRSLWDQSIDIPRPDAAPGQIVRYRDIMSNSGPLIAAERTVLMKVDGADRAIRLIAAMDQNDLDSAIKAFDADTFFVVAILALFLLTAASVQIFIGLRPLNTLHHRLNAVAAGRAQGLDGRFPSEVGPLVDVLNGLLEERGEMVERARASAADLAHGLKTPLAILSAEGRTLTEDGQSRSAGEIERQVLAMNAQVERQLARARVRGRGRMMGEGCELRPVFEKLVAAIGQLPRGGEIDWVIAVPPGLMANIDQVDLEEVAGNILDNARKWTTDRVHISAVRVDKTVEITIEDNGAGVPDADLGTVLKRGGRADPDVPGSGLGLAIAGDILEIYGGRMRLNSATPSGLAVVLVLPGGNKGAETSSAAQ